MVAWTPPKSMTLLIIQRRPPYRYQIEIAVHADSTCQVEVFACSEMKEIIEIKSARMQNAVCNLDAADIVLAIYETLRLE